MRENTLMHFLTSRLSRGAGLLSLTLTAIGLSMALATQANACRHLGNDVACPIGELLGSNSLGFDANGNAFFANGSIVPGDYNVQPSNTETGQGLFNLNRGYGADTYSYFGSGIDRYGGTDVDGDGYDDFLAGGYGSGSGPRIRYDYDFDSFGFSVSGGDTQSQTGSEARTRNAVDDFLGALFQTNQDTQIGVTPSGGSGGVRLSGYGRFGLEYNEPGATVATNTTSLTSRLRLQIDMSAESDGGIVFTQRFRQNPESNHVVAAGETLFRIALRYGVSVNSIAAANNFPSPDNLFVGQTLVIPGRGEAVDRRQGRTETSNETERDTAYRREALEYLFDESWGDHDIKFGAEFSDADKEKLFQQSLDSALQLFSNADCSTTNSCGSDVFTPSPVTFGDCGDGGCATTVPIEFLSSCDAGVCEASVPGFVDTNEGGVVAAPTAPRVTGETVATLSLLVGGKAYETIIIKTKDGTHYAVQPTKGHVFGRVKESKSRPGFWNPKGGDFVAPPPEVQPNTAAEVFEFDITFGSGGGTDQNPESYIPLTVRSGGSNEFSTTDLSTPAPHATEYGPRSRSTLSGSMYALEDMETLPLFIDGFESGDTTAWSSTVP